MCCLFLSGRMVPDCLHSRRHCTRFKANVTPDTLSGTRTILLVGMNNSAWLVSSAGIVDFVACGRSFARRATSALARIRTRCRCLAGRSRRHTMANRRSASAVFEDRESHRATRNHAPACLTAAVVMRHSVSRTSASLRRWDSRDAGSGEPGAVPAGIPAMAVKYMNNTTTDDNTLVGRTRTDT